MPNITEEKWIEMLEKKADGTYIAKYPKVKSKSGITFDEHLAQNVLMNEVHGMRVNSETKLLEYWDGEEYAVVARRPPMNVFYNEGNENIDVTGGWVLGYVAGSEGYTEFNKESTHLYLYSEGSITSTNTGRIGISTEFKINLSRLRYLKIEWENNAGPQSSSVYFLVGETQSDSHSEYTAMVQEDNSFNRKVSILDVSGLSGEYYIRVHARSTANTDSINRVKIYKIWGEE